MHDAATTFDRLQRHPQREALRRERPQGGGELDKTGVKPRPEGRPDTPELTIGCSNGVCLRGNAPKWLFTLGLDRARPSGQLGQPS